MTGEDAGCPLADSPGSNLSQENGNISMAFELLRPVNCVTSWTKPQEEDDQRRDKGRCGCAAAPGWSSHPPLSPWPSRSTRLVLGVVRMMTGKKILLLTQGLLSSDERIPATGLPQS